jgi:hypothetical protein
MTAKKRVKRITEMHVPLDETTPLHIVPFYVFLFGFVCLFGGFCFFSPVSEPTAWRMEKHVFVKVCRIFIPDLSTSH